MRVHMFVFSQEVMEIKDGLYSKKHLTTQGYDGSNNMLGKKSRVAVRLRKIYLLGVSNHCLGHIVSLPYKAIYNHINYMCTFQTHTFEILNLIKLSSTREHTLEEYKKTAPCNKLNKDPSKVRKVLSLKPTRFT